MLEVWKQIDEYPGYMISNLGRVYSLERTIIDSRGYHQKKGGIYLKQHLNARGYLFVRLNQQNKKPKNFNIHRGLAENFIPNPFNIPYVDHIDRDKENNQLNNLRWVFPFDNSQNITKCDPRNKLGIKNISYDEKRKKYVFAKCIREKHCLKRFKTLEEALSYKRTFT